MKKFKVRFLCIALLAFVFMQSCDRDETDPELVVLDQTITVEEDIESGELVGVIKVENEEQANLSFRLVSGNEEETFVLSNAGELSLSSGISLDYEEKESYELSVEVSNEVLSETVLVEIVVLDVEEKGLLLLNGSNYMFSDEGILLEDKDADPFDQNVSTHFMRGIRIAVGDLIEGDEEGNYSFEDVEMLFLTELYASGGTPFASATFEYAPGNASLEDVEGKSFFKDALFGKDGNDNGLVFVENSDFEDDIMYVATSGSIVLTTLSDNRYRLDLDLTVSEAKYDPDLHDNAYEADIIPETERRIRMSHEATFVIEKDDDAVVVEGD